MIKHIVLLFLFLSLPMAADGGWDFSRHSIPPEQIIAGGPPRDGIPALFDPKYLPADKAGFMQAGEQVLGVVVNGIARAYPLRVLSWHELVNDDFGGKPVLVSW